MDGKRSPSVRSRQLAAELRRLRDRADLTGDQVARRLGWSAAKVSRFETAKTTVGLGDLKLLLDVYEVSGAHREWLTGLGLSASQRGWWDAYADLVGPEHVCMIAMEAQAESVTWYAAQVVPGLLQTEDYAREVARSTLLISPPGEIERRVRLVTARQRVLARDAPLRLRVVLDETVLMKQVGDADVMTRQLRHLAEAAARPNVQIQILPGVVGAHPAIHGGFAVLRFAGSAAPDVTYIETMTTDLFVEREADVFRYNLALDRLHSLALDQEDSLRVISALANSAP